MYEIKSWRLRSQKVVIGIDIDDIGNWEDLLKVVLIDEKCRNLTVVIYGGELTRNFNQKKTSGVLQIHIPDLHSLANAADEGVSSVTK